MNVDVANTLCIARASGPGCCKPPPYPAMLLLTNVGHRLLSTLEPPIEGVVWFSGHGASGFDSVLIVFYFRNGFFFA